MNVPRPICTKYQDRLLFIWVISLINFKVLIDNLSNPSCAPGYGYETTSIVHHFSTKLLEFPKHNHIDRYWYCFDHDGHCKDFYTWCGMKCENGTLEYDPIVAAQSNLKSIRNQAKLVEEKNKKQDEVAKEHGDSIKHIKETMITRAEHDEAVKTLNAAIDAEKLARIKSQEALKEWVKGFVKQENEVVEEKFEGKINKLRTELINEMNNKLTNYAEKTLLNARIECLKNFLGIYKTFWDKVQDGAINLWKKGTTALATAGCAFGVTTATVNPALGAGAGAACAFGVGKGLDAATDYAEITGADGTKC
uniref:Uncharacterized protein n=1 Tax=Meloidogyne hapla TaxID=6305 RepID=A0A1I8B3X4_MELHA